MTLLGITLGSLNQYSPGGVAETLANSVGLASSTLNQYYATGGAAGQLCVAGGVSLSSLNQYYATGGIVGQFMSAATGTTGVTGFMAAPTPPSAGRHPPTGPRGL